MTELKFAITGASGSIGKYVLLELLNYPIDITVITRDVSKFANFNKDISIVEFDISKDDIRNYQQFNNTDILIHLAWDGLPNYKSLHHFETELPSQYIFLKRFVDSGLKSLFITGTCLEYGMQNGVLSEKLIPLPITPYGYAKDALRKQLELLQSKHPFALTWARLFYMYGEGQPSTSLYPKLKEAVLSGNNVFNMSGGEQLRDYLPINEVATFIVKLALLQKDLGIVNICSGTPISIRTLVEKWLLKYKWDIKLNFGYYPYLDYEPMAFWGDNNKLTAELK